MKRFAKILLALVALSFFGYWGYKQLKKTPSLLGKIHIDADSAIKVSIQEIKETIFLDVLTSPRYYFQRADFSDFDDRDAPDQGIDLAPFNQVFYTVPTVKNAIFGTFPINDRNAFEVFWTKEAEERKMAIRYAADSTYQYTKVEKKGMTLAWNTKNLVVAISPQPKKGVHTVFRDVLVDERTISDSDHTLIQALNKYDDHVAYVRSNGAITINFEDGKAVMAGNLKTTSPQRFMPEMSIEAVPEASFQIYFDANFDNRSNKDEFISALSDFTFFKKNRLNLVEIANRTNGYFSMAVAGKTAQKDTVVTYTFDDNFEKKETFSIQEKLVPKIQMNLGAENQSLKDYLRAQKTVDEHQVFEPFPLYKVYVKEGALYTRFDTFEGRIPSQKQISSSFFRCQSDFQSLREDLDLPILTKYFENLVDMHLFASQKEGGRIILQGTITAANPDINIISQLIPEKGSELAE